MKPKSQMQSATGEVRVAWLMPIMKGGDYMQPLFREFTRLYPSTLIFISEWSGFMAGFEDKFYVKVLPGYRFVALKRSATGGEIGFNWAPASIIWHLFKFHPDVLFTSAFSVWTLYGLVYKAFAPSHLIVQWDGASAGTVCMNSRLRVCVQKLMARFMDAFVSNSGEGIEYLRDVIGVPDSKLLHQAYQVPDVGALSSEEQRQAASRADSRPVFLFVGQIIKRKGWNYLLDAARRLVDKGLDMFSVTVVGDGEQREQLKARICSLGLQRIVNVVGSVPYQQMGAYFEAADVFVLPTLDDIWGMVVLEAMAFGKPVLCSKYAGARELVRPGVNGFVFDPYNVDELAGYMERFIQEPALIARFGQDAQQTIARHTPQQAAKVLATLVQDVHQAYPSGTSTATRYTKDLTGGAKGAGCNYHQGS